MVNSHLLIIWGWVYNYNLDSGWEKEHKYVIEGKCFVKECDQMYV